MPSIRQVGLLTLKLAFQTHKHTIWQLTGYG